MTRSDPQRMNARLVAVLAAGLLLSGCGADTAEPSVVFDGESCSSSDPADWPDGPPEILLTNDNATRGAIILGTSNDGFSRGDLVAYGTDVSTRPTFITALEIAEVAPESSANVVFNHGPGTYFMVCMPTSDTMVVLDDFTITD